VLVEVCLRMMLQRLASDCLFETTAEDARVIKSAVSDMPPAHVEEPTTDSQHTQHTQHVHVEEKTSLLCREKASGEYVFIHINVCMYLYIYRYIYIFIYVYVCIYTCIYIYICAFASSERSTHILQTPRPDTYMYMCQSEELYICIYIYTYIYVYMYIYIYTYI